MPARRTRLKEALSRGNKRSKAVQNQFATEG